ncbi:MAG TPA: succinate dehydrogenase assembly factor 2 [Thermohalobaculum sp.]|nr:succinate dehydrogenase assembly factor 2 [Thermohalobaculum sp.]
MTDTTRPDPETPDVELRRLRLRSWRRGMREMDLILGAFADAELAPMPAAGREAYRAFLDENDQALYAWVTAAEAAPARHRAMVARIRAFHCID